MATTTTLDLGTDPAGHRFSVDLELLLRTRLLLQANSGGGKSWALRRLAEQAAGKVPVVILDPEGEFASLREKHDFVLVGPGGETPAAARTAPLLARKMLELGASAVCDLFELGSDERHAWVAAFLDALIDAPKTLWRPLLVIVDEAHVYAPERGAGDSPATEAMLALATRGRKRGLGAVWATQRLGKLRKDGAAEMQNLLVGQTFIDLDRERAAEALGVARPNRPPLFEQLKTMSPGTFYALGRAFGATEPVRVKVGTVQTTHPEPGHARAAEPPPPPARVRQLLAKLGNLPQAAAEEADRVRALEAEVTRLRAELGAAKKAGAGGRAPAPAAAPAELAELRARVRELEARKPERVPFVPRDVAKRAEALARAAAAAAESASALQAAIAEAAAAPPPEPAGRSIPVPRPAANGHDADPSALGRGDRGERRILVALAARHPVPLTTAQIGTLAILKTSGGSFGTYMSRLRRAGLIEQGERGTYALTAAGLAAAGDVPRASDARALLNLWGPKFMGRNRDMLELFASEHGPFTKAEIAKRLGLDAGGGSFGTYLSRLKANGLIRRTSGGFEAVEEIRL